MTLVVLNHITLDGVMQSPARPDEDTRGGFSHGGWSIPGGDEVMGRVLAPRMAKADGALILGRRSYEEMLATWNARGGPFKDALNSAHKFVASSSGEIRLEWPNSTLLTGDVPARVADLKRESDLLIMGSGRLIHSLLPHGLIDEFLLFIHPVLVGSGLRLFEPGDYSFRLRQVESVTTTTGVVAATYRPEP